MSTAAKSSGSSILIALLVAELVSAIEVSMIYGAMPALLETFRDPLTIGWMLTSFLLVQAVAAALCGRLGDLFGRRRLLLVALAVAIVGSGISALWPTATGLIVGRAVQGMCGAVLPLCQGLVRQHLPAARVRFGIAALSASAIVVGGAIGAIGGALLAMHAGWRSIFLVTVVIAITALLVVWRQVPADAPAPWRLPADLLGGIVFAPAIAGLLYAATQLKYWSLDDRRLWMTVAASLALLVYWICRELSQATPLLDVRLLLQPRIALANLGLILLAIGSFNGIQIVFTLLPQPIATGVGFGTSAMMPSLLFIAPSLLSFAGAPLASWLARDGGPARPLVIGAVLLIVAWSAIALDHNSLPLIVAALCVQALGQVLYYAAVPMVLVDAAPQDRTSEVTGLSTVLRALGYACGAQLIAVLLASSVSADPQSGRSYPSELAYSLALGWVALASLGALFAALALRHLDRRTARHSPTAPSSREARLRSP